MVSFQDKTVGLGEPREVTTELKYKWCKGFYKLARREMKSKTPGHIRDPRISLTIESMLYHEVPHVNPYALQVRCTKIKKKLRISKFSKDVYHMGRRCWW